MNRPIIFRCFTILLLIELSVFCHVTTPVYGASKNTTEKIFTINRMNRHSNRVTVLYGDYSDHTFRVHEVNTDFEEKQNFAEEELFGLETFVLMSAVIGALIFFVIRIICKNKIGKGLKRNQSFRVPGRPEQEILPQKKYFETEPIVQQWTLTCLDGVYTGKKMLISQSIRFGRNPSKCNVIFPNGIGVSNIHCEIVLRNNRPYIRDISSTYGTYVNGERLTPQMLIPLKEGDEIYLGNNRERFLVESMS